MKKKILIIEDDQSLVKLVSEAIDPKKFDVKIASEADEGIDKAITDQPDVIVLDVLLPGKSGFTCLKNLKSRKETKKIPVIMLSNLGQDEEIEEGLKLGAIDYLVKADLAIDEVIEKITQAI